MSVSRQRTDLPNRPAVIWEGFDMRTRRHADVNPAQLQKRFETWNGWTIRPVDLYRLQVTPPAGQGAGFTITLDPLTDRRWWSYSFLPPVAGHHEAAVAVACEGGVTIHRLPDGTRTRYLAAHGGPVLCLAVSRDFKWLATGSLDQTVRLWTLAACDQPAPFGARFEPLPDGRWKVAAVTPQGFADGMGLKVGDIITKFLINAKEVPGADFAAKATAAVPNKDAIEFDVVRENRPLAPRLPFVRKREQPLLSLFPGRDREWVLWMPQGYYETSIAGDRRHLGWHINNDFPRQLPDHFPADRFEGRFRKPGALDVLIATADAAAAVQAAQPAVVHKPPTITVETPVGNAGEALAQAAGTLAIRFRVAVDSGIAGLALGPVQVYNDGRAVPVVPPPAPDSPTRPISRWPRA